MDKEKRTKLVFETLSKIIGFKIKPDKEFYITQNGKKVIYSINESLHLLYKNPDGSLEFSEYNILPIFKGGYKIEEIKKPLLAEEEKEFLRQFKFEELEVSNLLFLFNKNSMLVSSILLSIINFTFDGLEEGKRYSRKELEL